MALITQEEIAQLLGRSLTASEVSSFDVWESIAEQRLSDLLCIECLEVLLAKMGKINLPTDLQLVLARFFGGISLENDVEYGVSSKKVEDFSITYKDNHDNVFGNIVTANGATILKYSQCRGLRSGRTLKEEAKYYHHDRF